MAHERAGAAGLGAIAARPAISGPPGCRGRGTGLGSAAAFRQSVTHDTEYAGGLPASAGEVQLRDANPAGRAADSLAILLHRLLAGTGLKKS